MESRAFFHAFIKGLCVLVCVGTGKSELLNSTSIRLAKKVIAGCLNEDSVYACLADKAVKAFDRAMDADVALMPGISVQRNDAKVEDAVATSRTSDDTSPVTNAISRFLDTHKIVLDLSQMRAIASEEEVKDGGYGEGGGGGIGRRERKCFLYALTVLAGVFALSSPIILKTLALMAGKALIASKVALIMLGSIALKKIFQADSHEPVKVHTHTVPYHDDHDRYMDVSNYNYLKPPTATT